MAGDDLSRGRREHPAAQDDQELGEQHDADQRADRQVVQEALAQLDEIDVEHHHHEQEQHGHGADIDDDQDHRQELGAEQHEQPGRVEEGEDQEQHRMDGVARADDHDRRGDGDRRKQVEEERRQDHVRAVTR